MVLGQKQRSYERLYVRLYGLPNSYERLYALQNSYVLPNLYVRSYVHNFFYLFK